jgi:hypothetical protein
MTPFSVINELLRPYELGNVNRSLETVAMAIADVRLLLPVPEPVLVCKSISKPSLLRDVEERSRISLRCSLVDDGDC